MNEAVLSIIRDYLAGILDERGLELFDLQYRHEGRSQVLRVILDTPPGTKAGITLDDCSDVSRELGQYLDVEDLIDESYTLEVSSPGIDRPLRNMAEFKRFTGKMCKVRCHHRVDGEKVFIGSISEVDDSGVTLLLDGGQQLRLQRENISRARLWF